MVAFSNYSSNVRLQGRMESHHGSHLSHHSALFMYQREDAATFQRAINASLALLLLSLSLSGCSLVGETHHVFFLAKRTTKIEPSHFPYIRNKRLTHLRNRILAKRVWDEVLSTNPDTCTSRDYVAGFVIGFDDYLYRGGTGDPPVVPPRRYWNLRFRTKAGTYVIEDWYAGFRHGSQECRARGFRELAVVPSSLVYGQAALDVDRAPPRTDRAPREVPIEALPNTEPEEPTREPIWETPDEPTREPSPEPALDLSAVEKERQGFELDKIPPVVPVF